MHWQESKISRILSHMVIILCISLLCLTSIGQATAKYISEGRAGDTASVARFSPSLTSDSIEISGIKKPGDSAEKTFTVRNFSDDGVSEVAMKYKIILNTTGNLPLRFTLLDAEGNSLAVWDCDGTSGQQKYEYESPLVFSPDVALTHNYLIKAEWPADRNAAWFSGMTDAVYLAAEWEQID